MKKTKKLTLAALFLALGMVMPFLTMQIPEVGSMLLPMHIPVLLCGFICGWKYGLLVGIIVPILRSVVFGMPPMFPTAICMSFELATYGATAGWVYELVKKTKMGTYITLILSMITGRVVWGIASYFIYMIMGNTFTWTVFAAGAFLNAIPGIILQIVIIPPIVMVLRKFDAFK